MADKKEKFKCFKNKFNYWRNGLCNKEFDTKEEMLNHAMNEHNTLELD